MNATNLTFGIEIECFIPSVKIAELNIRIGGYHAGVQVAQLPAGWNAQRDGSLSTSTVGMTGVEIVSPVLSGIDGINQVRTVVAWLQSIGAQVNPTCGFHVHVGGRHLDGKGVAKLVCLVAQFEEGLYASTGTKSRRHNHYCQPVKNNAAYRSFVDADGRNVNRFNGSRYHVLNLSNLAAGKPTVEFRVFQGSLNVDKIEGYVYLCLGLVERAENHSTSKDFNLGPQSSMVRGGEGETTLNRLFSRLGWKASGRKHGIIDATRLAEIKAKLFEMANKYDNA